MYPAHRLAILAVLAAASGAHANTIMQWVDEDGRIHYSDHVPAEAEGAAVAVEIDPDHNIYEAPPLPEFTPTAPARRSTRDPAAARRAAKEAEERKEKCAKHQAQFDHLRSRMRAGYKASQYNRLMEQERSLKAKIAAYCR